MQSGVILTWVDAQKGNPVKRVVVEVAIAFGVLRANAEILDEFRHEKLPKETKISTL